MKTNSLTFARNTAIRIETAGGKLHGLAAVRAKANEDGSISLAVEFFAGDTERDGSGDMLRLFEAIAEMGLYADPDAPLAVSRGYAAGQVVEHYQVS
jgi:hypothetical protein